MKKILLLFKRILGIPINIFKSIRTFFKLLGFLILWPLVKLGKMSEIIAKYMDRNPKCAVLLLLLSLVLAGLLFYVEWNFVPSRKTLKTFGFFYYNLHELLFAGVFFFGLLNLFLVVVGFSWCIDKQYLEEKRARCEHTGTSVNLKFYENENSDKLSLDAENVYIHSWIEPNEFSEFPNPLPMNFKKKVLIQNERLLKNFLDALEDPARHWDDLWDFSRRDICREVEYGKDDWSFLPFELYIVYHQKIENVLDVMMHRPTWKLDAIKTYPNFMFCKMRLYEYRHYADAKNEEDEL